MNFSSWVLSTACSPLGFGLQQWGPCGVSSPARKPAPEWAPPSMGPHVWPGACCCTVFPWSHSLLSGIHLLKQGVLHGLQVDICSPVDFHGFHRGSCLTRSVPWAAGESPLLRAPPPPPSPLTLVSAEVFLSHVLTPLFSAYRVFFAQ